MCVGGRGEEIGWVLKCMIKTCRKFLLKALGATNKEHKKNFTDLTIFYQQ